MNDSNALVLLNECLRIQDNPLLELASKHSGVKAVYLFDRKPVVLFNEPFLPKAYFARKFEMECLTDTQEALHALGINLQLCENEAESLAQLINEHGISTIYSSLLSTTYERNLKRNLMERFEPNALRWIEKPLAYLIKPENAAFTIEALPEVFTVFRKKIEARLSVDMPSKAIEKMEHNSLFTAHKTPLPSLAELGYSDQTSDERTAHPFVGGERAAHERVNDYFFKRKLVSRYKQTRNGLIGEAYSTKFSAFLALGCISPQSVYAYLRSYEQSVEQNEDTYWVFFELLWRDYFKYLSLKHGDRIFKLGGIKNREYPWQQNKQAFYDWVNGQTKDRFVNAIMRELKQTGYTSNRGRQNAASYWAKTLKQDWRIGATYFQIQLIDYDVHSNWGNWNYVSGVGNDPRDRVFNTQIQAERYDPDQRYQKLWED